MTTTRPDVIARGAKVQLRRKLLSDARNDYAWRCDPDLARYDAAEPLRIGYDEFVRSFQEELRQPNPFRRVFAVESLAEQHIGNVMYYNIDLVRRECELGITIGAAEYWGSGFGSEAVILLTDYLFTTTALTRVYLHTLDWNTRAQRAFARAGFRDCGRSRRGPYRFHVMELLRYWRWEQRYQERAVPHPAIAPLEDTPGPA